MNVAVAYCCPLVQRRKYLLLAQRFARTWGQFPPASPHRLYIVYNGGEVMDVDRAFFAGIPHVELTHDNTGWDIGAFQKVADTVACDLLLCLGAAIHFYRPGWFELLTQAYIENGPGLYGCSAYLAPDWHVRTTSFWCPPEILRSYPDYIGSDRKSRYAFEHGAKSFTRHALALGFPCIMVTWAGTYPFEQWRNHGPDARTILMRDQHINLLK